MPYLIRTHDNQLLLLNNSAKSGVYSQSLSRHGLSRPTIIHRSNTLTYSATIDIDQELHIITKSSAEQVIHLHYKGNTIARNVILEDPKGIYNFSNLYAIYSNNQVHLFYTANQPIGQSSELIHHILCQENKIETYPILSFSSAPLGFRYMNHHDHIYLLYAELDTEYLLQLMVYQDGQWSQPSLVAAGSFPIDDFQFCISSKGHIHLLYVEEKYGRYHLIYKRRETDSWSNENILHTCATAIDPCIFTYHHGLWVSFLDGDRIQMILSMDNGNTFSKSVDCSLQGSNFERCHFVSAPNTLPDSFNANMLYASLSQSIRAGIISQIDMIGFHPDLSSNTELELFIDGIFHSLSKLALATTEPELPAHQSMDIINLQAENQELKEIQKQMIAQYNEMTELTKKIQEEGKKWRTKALSLASQQKENQAEKPSD